MAGGHSRRGFLAHLARDVGRFARELDGALRDVDDEARDGLFVAGPAGTDAVLPATPATRTATPDVLRRLCAELGIDAWADAAVVSSIASIRLTPATTERGTKLGGTVRMPLEVEWPMWAERPLDLVLQVALAELPPSPLPETGTLLVFFATEARPDGYEPRHRDACRVLLVREDDDAVPRPRPDALPSVDLVPSVELTLPLDPPGDEERSCDFERWMALRSRLAAYQSVALEDEGPDYHAVHRLLGYPDTLALPMEDDAARLEGGEPEEWRLLAQLSADRDLGLVLDRDERLFVWVRDDDLRAGRFDRVRAFVR